MEQLYKDFEKLVKKQHDRQRRTFAPFDTTCFRIYDRQQAEIPVTVDRYGDYVRIEGDVDSAEMERLKDSVVRMTYTEEDHVICRQRRTTPGGEGPDNPQGMPQRIEVREMGITYLVDLWNYRDTGLYLDHAVTRDLVKDHALGRHVLNLFCYTGSFTIAAAAGGAGETLSVDLSNTYLSWFQDNLKINGLSGPMHRMLREDALAFLESPPKGTGKFHMIILDPPTFSNSHRMDQTFSVQRDHPWCIQQASLLLAEGGVIIFSTNYSSFRLDPQLKQRFIAKEITRETIPPGFTAKRFPHRCWMITRR